MQGKQETVPPNYKFAKLNDDNLPPGAIDFTQPAAAALPAVVHIKTKTNAKQVSNNLPKSQKPANPFSDFFDDDLFNQFFGNGREIIFRSKGLPVLVLSSVMMDTLLPITMWWKMRMN